ncbi:MAG: hypothetical protein KJ065_13015 [Anaerolineae bacterium]|nr:hypothetical protein [Anaerolineae bacterium]
MATAFEKEQIFNESLDRLSANLMANLNKKDGALETHWSAAHADEYKLEGGQQVRQVFGLTSAYFVAGDERRYAPFVVKLIALSPTATRVHLVVVSPSPTFDDVHLPDGTDPEAAFPIGARESTRLEKTAARLLEFCANPEAETDTGMMQWLRAFNRLLTQGKDKRKPGNDT